MAQVRELTPRGRGGVSVLELSGAGALAGLAKRLDGAGLAVGQLRLVRLALGGEELDEALVWCESEARVELHLHGSMPLVARVEAELIGAGFERWDGGAELRTLEQRAQDLLPRASGEAAARMLLDQAEGALREELARCADLRGREFKERMEVLAERARRARYLLEPAHVVLAGVVNAGKSTLFNALVGSERALVTPAAGTTRDVVCEAAQAGDWPILVFDTAGERALAGGDLSAAVEAEGQRLGRRARESADVVLWLCPADGESLPGPPGSTRVVTRADLAPVPDTAAREPETPRLAAGPDPRGAATIVAEVIGRALDLPARAWESGSGVPFEAWMERALRAAADSGDPRVLADLLRAR